MIETASIDKELLVDEVMAAIDEGDDERLRDALADLHPADSANLVASRAIIGGSRRPLSAAPADLEWAD